MSHGEATAPAGGLQGRPPGHLHQVEDGPPRWLTGASKGAGTGIGQSTQIVRETRRFGFFLHEVHAKEPSPCPPGCGTPRRSGWAALWMPPEGWRRGPGSAMEDAPKAGEAKSDATRQWRVGMANCGSRKVREEEMGTKPTVEMGCRVAVMFAMACLGWAFTSTEASAQGMWGPDRTGFTMRGTSTNSGSATRTAPTECILGPFELRNNGGSTALAGTTFGVETTRWGRRQTKPVFRMDQIGSTNQWALKLVSGNTYQHYQVGPYNQIQAVDVVLTASRSGTSIRSEPLDILITHPSDGVENYSGCTVANTMLAEEAPPPLTVESITGAPERHDGETPFDFTVVFSEAVDLTNSEMTAALEPLNATVSASTADSGRTWTITATPNITNPNSQYIGITIPSPKQTPYKTCNQAGAICTADGRKLWSSRVVGVQAGAPNPGQRPPKALTVGHILDPDDTHPVIDYQFTFDNFASFDFQLVFSEPLANAPRTGNAAARLAWWQNRLSVEDGGTLKAVSYIGDDGLDVGREVWQMSVRPGIKRHSGVVVPKFTGSCSANNAVCTDADPKRKLTNRLWVPLRCFGASFCNGGPIAQNQEAADPLRAAYSNVPQTHDGATPFTFRLTFSEDVDISAADLKDHAFTVLNGTVTTATALNSGTAEWDVTIQPTGTGSLNILLSPTADCAATGAICTSAGTMLSTVPGQSIPYAAPAEPQPEPQTQQAQTPITASFVSVPAEHDGETAFWLELSFDTPVVQGSKAPLRELLGVTGGSETRLRRKNGQLDHWQMRIDPSSHDTVTVTLSPSPACGETGAVCTEDGRTFTTGLATQIQGPASGNNNWSEESAGTTVTPVPALPLAGIGLLGLLLALVGSRAVRVPPCPPTGG